LSVLSWNVDGLKSCLKDDDFVNFVTNHDLLFFCETWQRKSDSFRLDGYDSIFVPRKESLSNNSKRGHGGVCLFWKNSITNGISIQQTDSNGIIWIKCCKNYFSLEHDIYVCFLYIPPANSNYYIMHDIGFFEQLDLDVRKYSDLGFVSVIGDLNARCGQKSDILNNVNEYSRYIDAVDPDQIQFDLPHRFSLDDTVNTHGNRLFDLCLSSSLKIVNGRIGDDAGTGSFTFMSSKGQSLIDYVLCTYELFPFILDFNVHDFQTCSSHAAIEVKININSKLSSGNIESQSRDKIVWNSDESYKYADSVNTDIDSIVNIVNCITSNDIDVNNGVKNISNILYDKAFALFGQPARAPKKHSCKRKFKSPWYNADCESSRREFRKSNRAYRTCQSQDNRNLLLANRRRYSLVKRRARAKHVIDQKRRLHNLAKYQPRKFWNEIKKYKNKNSNRECKISQEDFYAHFKNLFNDDEVFSNDEATNVLNSHEVEQLDALFTLDDVQRAIKSLKSGKSSGDDELIAEMFVTCQDILSPILCKLFNHLFTNSLYPEQWTRGVIVPVPKKGDLNDVNNYRGITLTSIFSKIFSQMLDYRLRSWAEGNNLLSDYQFGFRKDRSTTDCIFILHSIINKVINVEKRKLYCAFVDFKKAFDKVYRDGIWYKLIKYGTSSKMVKMLKAIYLDVRSCVKVNGINTEYFGSYAGVKQGEPLSPLLFIFFINDMYDFLHDDSVEMFSIADLKLFLLLFADDAVLFSYTKEGLQCLLNKLYTYCSTWGVSVNTNKTVVMICKKSNRHEHIEMLYDDEKLEVVDKFTYLGVTISSNGKVYQAQKNLSNQALKAMFSLNKLFDNVSLSIPEQLKLFDSMVSPIMNYGAEIWGFHKAPDIERVHTRFLKQVLRVRQQTANAAVYGELCRYPFKIIRQIRILKYWYKIIGKPDSLMYKLFTLTDQNGNLLNEWSKQVRTLLDSLGFSYLWNNFNVSKLQLDSVIQRVYDFYFQHWYAEVRDSSKLETFHKIKASYKIETYLQCINNCKHRIALTRFRCSAHKLAIEEGRFRNIEREHRKCLYCKMNSIENEYHFLMVCPYYRDLRMRFIPKYYYTWPTIQKFKNLMQTENTKLIKQVSEFVYLAFLQRDEASTQDTGDA